MNKKVVFVVGDQYEQFAKNAQVVLERQMRGQLAGRAGGADEAQFVFGQGLKRTAGSFDPCELAAADRIPAAATAKIASLSVTHKRDTRHVLITEPRQTGAATYEMDFVVDSTMDRLGDHVTGQHIAGMLLVEAGRQAATAATELEYVADAAEPIAFIWNGLRLNFCRFAFPLPATIIVRLRREQAPDGSRPKYVAAVEILQSGQAVCEMDFGFGLMPLAVLSGLEAKAAQRAVDAAIAFPPAILPAATEATEATERRAVGQ
jgi:hypothetical protein